MVTIWVTRMDVKQKQQLYTGQIEIPDLCGVSALFVSQKANEIN